MIKKLLIILGMFLIVLFAIDIITSIYYLDKSTAIACAALFGVIHLIVGKIHE